MSADRKVIDLIGEDHLKASETVQVSTCNTHAGLQNAYNNYVQWIVVVYMYGSWILSLCARRVNLPFVLILGHGKRIFKDLVRLIAHFYS